MLEGIDKEWKKSNVLNQAVYNYLPPGDYTFKVRALNGDGEVGKTSTIKLTVKPPFWKTPWFIGIIAFIALIVLYWIDKFRMATIIENQNTRTTIATSLTKDMSTTLNNINVLSEMAKYKTDQDIERTKEYVTQISENSNRMIEVMDDMVWSINPENDGMDNLIRRMRKYASLVQQRFNVEISFYSDPALNNRRMQMDKRHELFLMFKEIVLNLGKHSNSRFAEIRIECIKSKMVLNVMDDGKGFDTDSVIYGRGLNEIRNRAASLHARVEIDSKVNNGTTVRLTMPF
jgi:signal transduction histidine kinase